MTKFLAVLIICLCTSLRAQNFSVLLGAAADGTITNWPVQVQPIGTNTAVSPPWLLMTRSQIDQCIATNQPAMTAWESNKAYIAQAKIDANIARLLELYSQIPEARTAYSQGRTLLATIDASLASGTNSQAQVVARIRQMATIQDQTIRYVDGITEVLQRLGPVLKQIYKPEEDQ